MRSEDSRQALRAAAETFGCKVPDVAVCPGHAAPLDFLWAWCVERPDVSLVLGPRGGGKSYLAAFATHWDSLQYDFHGTRILGGSLSQSEQIYTALRDFERRRPHVFEAFTRTRAVYTTGSEVAILAASPTSVRGPHIPTLRLDEVDEMDEEVRDASLGMCMEQRGVRASVSLCSTWHRIGGPMEGLLGRAQAGEFPSWTFCAFEVLERCTEERSGPNLERCPDCPLKRWCHEVEPGQTPKAKRANGHYAIDSLIQKVRATSLRVFEADYLCKGPKADGLWFPRFELARHATEEAEYTPSLPVYLAVDSGVFTGAVWFQVWRFGAVPLVTVFADYLSQDVSAESNARAILEVSRQRCNGLVDFGSTDPAGGARNPIGPTVLACYAAVGLHLRPWPVGSVSDGLERIEGLLTPATGLPRILIHPRCEQLTRAFRGYRRAKRQGQWMDYPEDPQHPFEDVMDSLRGGLAAAFGTPEKLFL
jgi:hypothetical protein